MECGEHSVGHLHGVGSGELRHPDEGCLPSVECRCHAVGYAPEFDFSHILEAQHSGVGGAEYDVAKFLGGLQLSLAEEGVLKSVACIIRSRTGRSACDLHILGIDGSLYLRHCDIAHTHGIGVEPDAHTVIARAKHLYIAHTLDAAQSIHDV